MLRARVLTAVVLLIAVIAALFYLPRLAWIALAAALLAQSAWEWGGLARMQRAARAAYVVTLVAILLLLQLAGDARLVAWAYYAAAAFWALAAPLWLWRRPTFRSAAMPLAAGVLVLVPAVCALVDLRDRGPAVLLIVMAAIWISDTAAMFVGRRFGRHKLAPEISPGKTWEGVVGALAAVALYGLAVGWLAGTAMFPGRAGWTPQQLGAWLALLSVLAVAGIVGDLFESQMKRAAGVKDSGALLPGHGGLLDRIDALTSALPIAALALSFLS
jgi:phosphatidate cytidylyltransferase